MFVYKACNIETSGGAGGEARLGPSFDINNDGDRQSRVLSAATKLRAGTNKLKTFPGDRKSSDKKCTHPGLQRKRPGEPPPDNERQTLVSPFVLIVFLFQADEAEEGDSGDQGAQRAGEAGAGCQGRPGGAGRVRGRAPGLCLMSVDDIMTSDVRCQ